MISSPQLEDVPELMQLIQSHLPVKEAARTSVLSKSWLHAWSTIPNLRFHDGGRGRKGMTLVDMNRILKRYIHDNIPIERFDLDIFIYKLESYDFRDECTGTLATKTCTLKELSLSFRNDSRLFCYDLPHEILSFDHLTKIRVLHEGSWLYETDHFWPYNTDPIDYHWISPAPVIINCVSLRELYLNRVSITQELLDGILSSCRLLVKIELIKLTCGLYSINVKKLPCLYELRIVTEDESSTALEINDVPNLRVFTWGRNPRVPFNSHSISLGNSLKYLSLSNVVTDNASLDIIKSGTPSLESLTIAMRNWNSESFHFTCASIKRLILLSCPPGLIKVEVYAPNLLFFRFSGDTMPCLLFPVSTLIEQTVFWLDLKEPVDASFFLKMREALALSSNCDIHITTLNREGPPPDIDIDDLKTRLPSPHAMNVQQLSFETRYDQCMWERSPFFYAFFEICHPNHVTAMKDRKFEFKNHFCKVMLTEVLEKQTTMASWSCFLKHVQISRHTKWETLTNSHKGFLKRPTPVQVDFKLEWC